MFPSARWKAYLTNLQDESVDRDANSPEDPVKAIWRIYHSQKLWFTREEKNGHARSAREKLDQASSLLAEAAVLNADLEETLANTPKPSEVLDWGALW